MKYLNKILILTLAGIFLLSSCSLQIRSNPEEVASRSDKLTVVSLPISEKAVENNADRVVVTSAMVNAAGLPLSYEKEELEIDSSHTSFSYDLEYFGAYEITIEYFKGNTLIDSAMIDYTLTAEEYNFAYLVATVPVTYFSMLVADQVDDAGAPNYDASGILNPNAASIVSLSRPASYNWDSLLPGMTKCPFTSQESSESAMLEYAAYLHELDRSSKFHVFVNDLYLGYLLDFVYRTGISFNALKITVISDGSGTYASFRNVFGSSAENDKSVEIYNDLERHWSSVKHKAENKDKSYLSDIFSYALKYNDSWNMRYIPAILVNDMELDIQWIMSRNNKDVFGDTEVYHKYVETNPRVKALSMYGKDSAGKTTGLMGELNEEETAAFKELFNIRNEELDNAIESGKNVMIFLGTRDDQAKHNLEDFLSFTTHYLGPDYVYFYKGHPGDITAFNNSRSEILEKYDVTNLEAGIPAELYNFFYPEAAMGGYNSSTYQNASDVRIPIIATMGPMDLSFGYTDRVETFIEYVDGKYHVVDMNHGKRECYWNPAEPDKFNWI